MIQRLLCLIVGHRLSSPLGTYKRDGRVMRHFYCRRCGNGVKRWSKA